MPEITIAVCALNEIKTLPRVLEELIALPLDKEILVVDDGSWDQTGALAQRYCSLHPSVVRLFHHGKSRGKGAGVREALKEARGTYFAIQDADLEYEVSDLPLFLDEMRKKDLDVLFGSRFLKENPTKYPLYYLANQWVSGWISFLTGCRITDAYTGRKVFKTQWLNSLGLIAPGFEIEAEIAVKTGKAARAGTIRFSETAVNYHPRTKKEGKKIGLLDGIKAFIRPLFYS